MDARVLTALANQPGVSDWMVRFQHGHGAQVYVAGNALENVRTVDRRAYEIEIYNDHLADGQPVRGSVIVPVAHEDLDRLPAILDEAVGMASLVHNPPWSLPDPVDHPDVPLADAAILSTADASRRAREVALEIRDQVAGAGAGVRLSAVELFFTAVDEELQNSQGLEGQSSSTRVLLELNLLAGTDDGSDEAEFFHQGEWRRVEDIGVARLVETSARHARDAAHAERLTGDIGAVVMSDSALEQLLGPAVIGSQGVLLIQTSAASAYAKLSRFEVGDSVYLGKEPTGDSLTVRSNARRPYAVQSYQFDADGLPAQDVLVVEDGVLRRRTATQRYASYLGIPPTGRAATTEIAPGTLPMEDLMDGVGRVLHVVAFSAANVEAVTGNFGMEVRLGYVTGPDGARPVRGGSVSGNLFEALASARFSREVMELRSYAGPRAMRFEDLQLATDDS
jgi:predicted Zn-dependent protease